MSATEGSDSKSSLLTRLFGYLGGIFVLAGLGVFIEMQWALMNSFARIAVTLGSGIAVFVMALFADADERWKNVAVPLFLLAAVLQPMGILVAIAEFSKGGDDRHAILLTRPVTAPTAAQERRRARNRRKFLARFSHRVARRLRPSRPYQTEARIKCGHMAHRSVSSNVEALSPCEQ